MYYFKLHEGIDRQEVTFGELSEAFACGNITPRQFRELRDRLFFEYEETNELSYIKRSLLSELIATGFVNAEETEWYFEHWNICEEDREPLRKGVNIMKESFTHQNPVTAREVIYYEKIHYLVDREKVEELKASIRTDGWKGFPILTWGERLITGTHRAIALKELIFAGEFNPNEFVAEDIGELIEFRLELMEIDESDIDEGCLRKFLADTWVEEYAEELSEW